MNLLTGLNTQQQAAVLHTQGPLLIFAGAGSGKTRTLTNRIAHLILEGHATPYEILAVTFTNKSAKEMTHRLETMLGAEVRKMWLGTFHALCARMLRMHGERIGLDPRYAIFDTDDQTRLMKDVLKEMNIDSERFPAGRVLGRISDYKNRLQSPETLSGLASTPHQHVYASLYRRYQERLRSASALDFDDLLGECVRLLRESAETRAYWSQRFKYVLIDEFQDVNAAQFEWARLLAAHHRNICVVGDDDQSIYAWRGADVRIILDFENHFSDAKVIRLEQNYRSTQNILDAAYGVIANNPDRADKRLWTQAASGEKITLHAALNAQEEALWIVRQVESIRREQHLALNDFAILCRINAQTRPLEEAFMRQRVPLRLVGTQRFYDRKEIRDLMAYLKFLYNPNDSVSTLRLINTPPRGIGGVTIARLDSLAQEQGRSLGAVLLDENTDGLLTPAVARKVEPLRRLLQQLRMAARQVGRLSELVDHIIERTGYNEHLRLEKEGMGMDREANVREFLVAAETFDRRLQEDLDESGESTLIWGLEDPLRLGQFLSETALEGNGDKEAQSADAVTLMTLHASKGLEFPVVFLAGMEQGLLPHSRALQSDSGDDKDLQEERRLMYVGLTRARERAILTHAAQRTLHGRTESTTPSQFLREIPDHLLEKEGLGGGGLRAASTLSPSWGKSLDNLPRGGDNYPTPFAVSKPSSASRESTPPTYRIGNRIAHDAYGEGIVVAASPHGGSGEWVEVAFFGGAGKKKLIVAFANISLVGT